MYTYEVNMMKEREREKAEGKNHIYTHNVLFPLGRKCYLFIPFFFASAGAHDLHVSASVYTLSVLIDCIYRL